MNTPQVKCRPMAARRMRGYSEDFPKSFHLDEPKTPRSLSGPSLYDKPPKKDSFWVDLGGNSYSLDGSQTKAQRLIFITKTPEKPHRIRYEFELSSVSSGSISSIVIPEIEHEMKNSNGKYEVYSLLISSASAVGFKASDDFSGVLKILNIYPVYAKESE